MKTFKVFLKDYQSENISAENFAIDDMGNLVVGQNLFHRDEWKRVLFLYDNAVNELSPYDYPEAQNEWISPSTSVGVASSGW